MKKNNKKGFTIVELVIVIAVIAILASVLIPVFSNVVEKANLSADKQTVRQMNVALATEDKATTYNEMADALYAQGYNVKDKNVAAPASNGHKYYWSVEHNTIVLVKSNTVIFPEDSKYDNFDAENEEKWMKIDASNYVASVNSAESFQSALDNGNSIKLAEDLKTASTFNVTSDVTIDLNGKDLDASENGSRPFDVDNGASLTIDATGSNVELGKWGLVNIKANVSADVTLIGGNYFANENLDNGSFIKVRANNESVSPVINLHLENVNYTDDREVQDNSYLLNPVGFTGTLNCTVKGGTFIAPLGFIGVDKIEDATITTKGVAIYTTSVGGMVDNCTITVTNESYTGKFANNDLNSGVEGMTPAACVATSGGATITVKNCKLESKPVKENGIPYGSIFVIYTSGGTIVYENLNNEYDIPDGCTLYRDMTDI